jgi:phospholipase C
MATGVDRLQHIVVLMMENRSFDHLLGYLKAQDPRIDGVDGTETNPDTNGAPVPVTASAKYQSQLQPDPGHHWPDVDLQIHGDPPGGPPMQGFVKAYYQKQQNVQHSHGIMDCFDPQKVPVITTLARQFAVFNRWFSSLPGPTIPNRAFAHFGTSFGKTDMSLFYLGEKYKTIYERMVDHDRTAKIYYYDAPSATLGMAFILKEQPQLFATYDQFKADCASGNLPDYSFVEPNYTDHAVGGITVPAADQHPDHNVLAGEEFIADVYNNIVNNQALWESTALLIVYDEHGGIYDHVVPPACTPDEFTDAQTGFRFDRLGVRVPAVLVSPWIPAETVVDRVFDHASIPATVTKKFIGDFAERSPRELAADTFLDLLSLEAPRQDYIAFEPGSTPPVPPDAADPSRALSGLLAEHVQALAEVDRQLPPEQQTPLEEKHLATEGGAAGYIEAVMAKLHPKPAAAGQ